MLDQTSHLLGTGCKTSAYTGTVSADVAPYTKEELKLQKNSH